MLQYSYRSGAPATSRKRTPADQSWSDYSAIVDRPRLQWPNGARVALWVCPNILHYEFVPPPDAWVNAWGRSPAPDVMMYARQDYAHRVGFWRMLKLLDKHHVKCTAVVNADALRHNPEVCAATVERGWAYLAHGINNTRFIYGHTAAAERRYWREMLDTVQELTGVRMKGAGGPGPQAATEHTPDLLAEAGFVYHADWFHDDQPAPLNVRRGQLISLPYAVDTNDAPFLGSAFEAEDFADAVMRQFDQLMDDGAHSGRVMCLSLHPALFGQPQRIRHLERILDHLLSHPLVWQASGDEIAEHYVAHHLDAMRGHLAETANVAALTKERP
jgi:allantoinase